MGRWAAPSFLPRVPGARLPRPAPLFPRSGGDGDEASLPRSRRSGPRGSPPTPAPASAAVPDLPLPLRQLRGGGAR